MPSPSQSATINTIRERFEKELSENPSLYHKVDIERVRNEEWQVRRFLQEYPESIDEAFSRMLKSLQWKCKFGIHDRCDQDFPRELWELNNVEVSGEDNEHRLVQWESFRNQRTFKEIKELMLQFIAHVLERVDRMAAEQGFILIMDINGAGMTNLDLDLIKFKINIVEHFPQSVRSLIILDFPWLLSSLLTVIVNLLTPKLRPLFVQMKSKELQKFIPLEQIPKSLGGKREKITLPSDLKPLCHLKEKLELTDKFIDSFYNCYKMKQPLN